VLSARVGIDAVKPVHAAPFRWCAVISIAVTDPKCWVIDGDWRFQTLVLIVDPISSTRYCFWVCVTEFVLVPAGTWKLNLKQLALRQHQVNSLRYNKTSQLSLTLQLFFLIVRSYHKNIEFNYSDTYTRDTSTAVHGTTGFTWTGTWLYVCSSHTDSDSWVKRHWKNPLHQYTCIWSHMGW